MTATTVTQAASVATPATPDLAAARLDPAAVVVAAAMAQLTGEAADRLALGRHSPFRSLPE
jgi:hypothetical protein